MNHLYYIAIISLIISFICAIIIIIDIISGHRQHMWIMNIVWPVTALYAGPFALLAYYKIGRLATHQHMHHQMEMGEMHQQKPFWQSVVVSALHCGAGCTLGDIMAEWLLFLLPFTLFGKTIFAGWFISFIAAFLLGIIFQYFSIKPMKKLSSGEAIKEAIKADTLSLASWQIGMYGWMAIAVFVIFHHDIQQTNPVFWLIMQVAMIAGFFTSYGTNWWLLKKGIKEPM